MFLSPGPMLPGAEGAHMGIRAYHSHSEGVRNCLGPMGAAGPAPMGGLCLFFQEQGVGKITSQGSQSHPADRQSPPPDPKTGAPANSWGGLTPCFLTHQMSVAQHPATTTCKSSSLESSVPAWHLADPEDLGRSWRKPPAYPRPHPHTSGAPSRVPGCFKSS